MSRIEQQLQLHLQSQHGQAKHNVVHERYDGCAGDTSAARDVAAVPIPELDKDRSRVEWPQEAKANGSSGSGTPDSPRHTFGFGNAPCDLLRTALLAATSDLSSLTEVGIAKNDADSENTTAESQNEEDRLAAVVSDLLNILKGESEEAGRGRLDEDEKEDESPAVTEVIPPRETSMAKKGRPPPRERVTLTPKQLREKNPKLNIIQEPTIAEIARIINNGKAKNIIVMTGAGISTSAGIPDFRSPETGLYANLQKYDLPYAEAIFDINYFKHTSEPFYTLAKELYPGNFKPTFCHYFIRLLHERGILLRNYTQNIDTLERVAGLPDDKLVEAHGSFHTAHCLNATCRKEYAQSWIKDTIFRSQIPMCEECGGLVKPDIVFFGEGLPMRFCEMSIEDFRKCDMLIVIGTSLQVQPFASLIDKVKPNVPRLLINREEVGVRHPPNPYKGFSFDGEVGKYRRDAVYLGTCDDGVMELARFCGMLSDLRKLCDFEHRRLEEDTGACMMTAEASERVDEAVSDDLTASNIAEPCATVDRVVDDAALSPAAAAADEQSAIPGVWDGQRDVSAPDFKAVTEPDFGEDAQSDYRSLSDMMRKLVLES